MKVACLMGPLWLRLLLCPLLLCPLFIAALTAPRALAEVVVEDDLGNRVSLRQPAQRIVALAPSLVEIVYAVGAGEQLVGAVSFSDYPVAAQQIPRVGSHKDFSIESIARLKPDLVLAWHSGNGSQRIAPIKALGIPVFYTEPRQLEDIGRAMEQIGLLAGSAAAVEARRQFDGALAELRQRYSRETAISVFYQMWNEPLRTLNGEHLISDVMRLCGGRNIFAEATALAPQVSVESILRLNPQVIIASGMAQERPEWLDDWHRWPSLQAVQEGQLKFIPPDVLQRHTPRILEGARLMCEHLQAARDHYGRRP